MGINSVILPGSDQAAAAVMNADLAQIITTDKVTRFKTRNQLPSDNRVSIEDDYFICGLFLTQMSLCDWTGAQDEVEHGRRELEWEKKAKRREIELERFHSGHSWRAFAPTPEHNYQRGPGGSWRVLGVLCCSEEDGVTELRGRCSD